MGDNYLTMAEAGSSTRSFLKQFVFAVAFIVLIGTITVSNSSLGAKKGGGDKLTDLRSNAVDLSIKHTTSDASARPVVPARNPTSETRIHEGVDFVIAGFPKCGTSTLLYSFVDNEETEMPAEEYCAVSRHDKSQADSIFRLKTMMEKTYTPQSKDGGVLLRGIKCPGSVRDVKSIELLELLNPETKIIIGVRHPVLLFQSFFNYRVVSHNHETRFEGKKVPDPNSLIGSENIAWRGVYTDLAKYEDSLMQLGKVDLSTGDLKQMAAQGLILAPTSLRVFLYEVDQLSDVNDERATQFRRDMQRFLGLENPILPFDKRNVVANKGTYPETINICDEKYQHLREVLIHHADKTRHWIRDRFIKSDDVIIGGDKQHFLELLAKWGEDPCPSEKKNFNAF